jgi:hypothetical protein
VDPNVVEEAVAILQAVQRVVNAPNGVAKLHRFFCRNIPKKYTFDPYAWEGVNETQLSERGASKTVAWRGGGKWVRKVRWVFCTADYGASRITRKTRVHAENC